VNWIREKQVDYLIILDRDDTLMTDAKSSTTFRKNSINLLLVEKLIKFSDRCYFTIATNQSAVGKKIITYSEMIMFNQHLVEELAKVNLEIVAVAACPHLPPTGGVQDCRCRKPKSKMLTSLISLLKVNMERTLFIGNNTSDELSAKEAGIKYLDVDEVINSNVIHDWIK
jgi:histidinol-phosphate phosphatase family protein